MGNVSLTLVPWQIIDTLAMWGRGRVDAAVSSVASCCVSLSPHYYQDSCLYTYGTWQIHAWWPSAEQLSIMYLSQLTLFLLTVNMSIHLAYPATAGKKIGKWLLHCYGQTHVHTYLYILLKNIYFWTWNALKLLQCI